MAGAGQWDVCSICGNGEYCLHLRKTFELITMSSDPFIPFSQEELDAWDAALDRLSKAITEELDAELTEDLKKYCKDIDKEEQKQDKGFSINE